MKNQAYTILILVIIVFLTGAFIGRFSIKEKIETIKVDDAKFKQITMNLPAVDSNQQGVVAQLITEVRPGSGLVLVNINDILADFNTQFSARTAAEVAGNYTNIDLSNLNIIYQIKADAGIIGGPSAGSAMAISTVAALLNKDVNQDVMITGTIEQDGSIGQVGAITEKAKAAKEVGAKKFLVPAGSKVSNTKGYERVISCNTYDSAEYCQINYIPKEVSFTEEIGIEIIEVKNIDEVVKHFVQEEEILME